MPRRAARTQTPRRRAPLFTTLTGVAALLGAAPAASAQHKDVYIACDDHTDYFWTADAATYRASFLRMLDYYMNLADSTAGNPPDRQSRFNADGSFWLWEYERNKTPAEWARLISKLRDGHLSAPMTALVSCYGGCPAEAVLRGMYYPGRLERRYGLEFDLAVAMENQTLPWGLASLWAGSGAKYSWRGVCGCVSRVPSPGDREHDIYWYTGPDGKRVLMKWNTLNDNQSLGGYAEARDVPAAVQYVTTNAPFNGFNTRYPYSTVGVFGKGWDDLETLTSEFVTYAGSLTNASRRVIVSNELDFFRAFEPAFGAGLPTEAYSYGNEWELYCASLAEVSASVKRSVEGLRGAEAMAAIVAPRVGGFMEGREAARDLAFMDLGLYWEHDWTGDGPVPRATRAAWQRQLAGEVSAYVDTLHADGAAALSALIPNPSGSTRFYAFNPLGHARSDAADFAYAGPAAVHVVEVATGQEVPSQVVTLPANAVGGGDRRLRVWAEGVPAVGYKVYEVLPGGGAAFPPAATVTVGGPTGGGTATVTYTIESNDRDATSTNTGSGPHLVSVSGYAAGEPVDFVGSDSEQQSAAAEFRVTLAAGTTIRSAFLTVRAAPSQSPSPTGALAIRLYDVDDAQPFVNGPFGDLLNHHPVGAAQVLWPASSWPAGTDRQSPDLTPLVQSFLNRAGYAPDKHIGFVVTEGTTQANRYVGWDDSANASGTPARLTITYDDPSVPPTGASAVIENATYKVTLDGRGAITGLLDKTRGGAGGREFAQAIGGLALNDMGGGGGGGGTVTVENAGPVSVTLKAVCATPIPHESRVTLYRAAAATGDGPRIDVANAITQNFSDVRTYAYSFNIAAPVVRHEEIGAIATARLRSTPGGSYATRNARYDYLTLNHFADVSAGDDSAGVTLANADCYYFRLGQSTTTTLDTSTPQLNPLIGGQVDGTGLGIQGQGGDTLFRQRFSLRTHGAFDAVGAMRSALEFQNPLITAPVSGSGPSASLPAAGFTGVTVSDPAALLWAFKPAEDGVGAGGGGVPGPGGVAGGLIARLWNFGSGPAAVTVQVANGGVRGAVETTHLETDLVGSPVTVDAAGAHATVPGRGMQTLRLTLCRSDFNGDLEVNGNDISDYINAWYLDVVGGTLVADFNGDGETNGNDISDYINAWYAAVVNGGYC